MAYYSIFPTADSTIYSHPNRTELNTGQDEILELVKERSNTDNRLYPSRILMKFDPNEIHDLVKEAGGKNLFLHEFPNFSTKLANIINGSGDIEDRLLRTFTASLELTLANAESITSTQVISVHNVSQSWEEGTGRYSNLPTSSDGVSWKFRDDNINETQWRTSSFNVGSNGANGKYGSTGNVSGSFQILGGTPATSSIMFSRNNGDAINFFNLPSSSAHQFTIDGVDFIGVASASLFEPSGSKERYFDVDKNTISYLQNLSRSIDQARKDGIVNVKAHYTVNEGTNRMFRLELSSSLDNNLHSGSGNNITYTASRIDGNTQDMYFLGGSSSLQGGIDGTETGVTDIPFGGGTYYTTSRTQIQNSQQFLSGKIADVSLDVTEFTVQNWTSIAFDLAPSIPNLAGHNAGNYGLVHHGYMLKFPDSIEANTSQSIGALQYFSIDTHTLFPPKLTFKWDDSVHNFQSSAKTSGDLEVSLYRNYKEYNIKDEAIFRIHVRDKYPTRAFSTTSNNLTTGYFTTSSFYSVRDAYTEREIIPFDTQNTKLSADSEGMFFKLFMNSFQPERYYRILFRHQNDDGIRTYDNNYIFKVIR